MEALRQSDPASPQLAAVEGALCQLLRLLPVAASAAEHFGHDLPLEEFIFHVSVRFSYFECVNNEIRNNNKNRL